jgi:O-antigen biosynthesis protein
MNNNSKQSVLIRIKNSFKPLNIYQSLKSIYLNIFPKGSKAYIISHGFLRTFLRRFNLLNLAYQEWIRRNDDWDEEKLNEIRTIIKGMQSKPSISILMPVYNPPVSLLKEAIQSVINQPYPYWELCIADDASTNPGVKTLINNFIQADPRIKAVFRSTNGHISAASNSALELVQHSFVALLDHDDLLHPLALFFVAMHILEYPDSKIIYSDEDKITINGRRLDPYFKPDFNYELILGHNMVSHLGVYRTETIHKIGGFREGLEGSQDYDLLLRVLERIKPSQIHHIPYPLYHWRISRESAAEDLNVKPYAIQAGIRALQEHLDRVSRMGRVRFSPELSAYKIDYPLPSLEPSVSILINAQDISENLIICVTDILKNTNYQNYEIRLCLPRSVKKKVDLDQFGWGLKVQILYLSDEISSSFAKSINTAASFTNADYVVFLDKSLYGFPENWLSAMIAHAQQSDIGVFAPKLLYKNEVVYSCGVVLLPTGEAHHMFRGKDRDDDGYFGWAKLTREYSALSEKCLLIKRESFAKVNGFSENYRTPFFTGIDLCLRLKEHGYRNTIISPIELYIQANHHYNMTSEFPPEALDADQQLLKEIWEKCVRNDTAFNPNLAIIDEGKITVDLSPKFSFPGQNR